MTIKDHLAKKTRISAVEVKNLKIQVLELITNMYSQREIEFRIMERFQLKLKQTQKYIKEVRQEIQEEATVLEVEEARERQKTFIMSRIHFCLEQANKKIPAYEKLLIEWINKYNSLWRNKLEVENLDSDKVINISFVKKDSKK